MIEPNSVLQKFFNNNPELRAMLPQQANYTYWKNKQTQDMYFYTTHRIYRKGKPRFVSGVYRYIKTKKMWRHIKEAGHAKKKDAIARAYRLFKAQA